MYSQLCCCIVLWRFKLWEQQISLLSITKPCLKSGARNLLQPVSPWDWFLKGRIKTACWDPQTMSSHSYYHSSSVVFFAKLCYCFSFKSGLRKTCCRDSFGHLEISSSSLSKCCSVPMATSYVLKRWWQVQHKPATMGSACQVYRLKSKAELPPSRAFPDTANLTF